MPMAKSLGFRSLLRIEFLNWSLLTLGLDHFCHRTLSCELSCRMFTWTLVSTLYIPDTTLFTVVTSLNSIQILQRSLGGRRRDTRIEHYPTDNLTWKYIVQHEKRAKITTGNLIFVSKWTKFTRTIIQL